MQDINTDSLRTPHTDFKAIRVMVINLETKTIKRFKSVLEARDYFKIKNSQKICRILKGDGLYTHEGINYKFEYFRN